MAESEMVMCGSVDASSGSRIAVVLEAGRRGAAALVQAAALAAASGAELTVVAIAPKAAAVCRCCGGVSPHAYNCAVRDEVAEELQSAVAGLGSAGQDITSKLLVEGSDPPLEKWIAQERITLVLLPARWGVQRLRSHPAARPLRRSTDATIRIVGTSG
jgi:hypothetical protein